MTYLGSVAFVATSLGLLAAVLAYDIYDRWWWRRRGEKFYRQQMMKRIAQRRKKMEWL